ncbi:MAG: sulfatase [Myxococcales bacterium]|nr:sulfatase [Myxococcales bacterium]
MLKCWTSTVSIPSAFVPTAVLAIALGAGPAHASDSSARAPQAFEARPNIVLIIIDTLRADRVGAYGFPAPTTPELDEFARRGVRFERVLTQSTWTRPSIGSMLTSLHPRTLGLYREADEILDDSFVTLAEVLRSAGYWTAGATANPSINSYFNFHQGFDHHVDSDVVFAFMPGAREQSSRDHLALPRARSVLTGLLDAARADCRQPCYLQVALMEVHESERIQEPTGPGYAALADAEASPEAAKYIKALRLLSLEIGLFVRSLLRLPGWKDTLFVFTSDHGESFATEHGGLALPRWHGHLVYETQTLVPLILYDTSGRLPAGRVVRRPVRLLDLMPTLLDYARLPGPADVVGTSLMPLLSEPPEDVDLPPAFVVETQMRKMEKLGVYSDEWIYIENRDGHAGTNPRALQRPGVEANGAATDVSGQHPEVVEERAAYLKRWEESHPRAQPTVRRGARSPEMEAQLRALGYLD